MQPLVAVLVAGRDAVEVVLHARREPVVDEPAEVLLEQVDDGEGEERRHERGALLEDIATVEDRADDRGVRRRAADAELLERAYERRLGVARRRVRLVTLRLELDQLDGTTLGQIRQAALVVVGLLVGVATFLVRGEEAAERNHRAGGAELRLLAAGRRTGDAQRNGLTLRILHLRRDRSDPDQLVQRVLIAVELSLHVLRRAERVARRANRLVRLLRVLHLALVPPWLLGNEVRAVQLAGLRTGRLERRLRQGRRIGPHVRDVAVLVQALRDPHRGLGGEAKLAACLLLQRRRHERRARLARVRLALDSRHVELGLLKPLREPARRLLVELKRVRVPQLPVVAELPALREALAVHRDEPRLERVPQGRRRRPGFPADRRRLCRRRVQPSVEGSLDV